MVETRDSGVEKRRKYCLVIVLPHDLCNSQCLMNESARTEKWERLECVILNDRFQLPLLLSLLSSHCHLHSERESTNVERSSTSLLVINAAWSAKFEGVTFATERALREKCVGERYQGCSYRKSHEIGFTSWWAYATLRNWSHWLRA